MNPNILALKYEIKFFTLLNEIKLLLFKTSTLKLYTCRKMYISFQIYVLQIVTRILESQNYMLWACLKID